MSVIFCTFVADLEKNQAMTAEEQKMLNDLVKMNQDLANRIQEQANQIAWLQRQLFGRKSEKLPIVDSNQLSLFEETISQETVEAQQFASDQIEK